MVTKPPALSSFFQLLFCLLFLAVAASTTPCLPDKTEIVEHSRNATLHFTLNDVKKYELIPIFKPDKTILFLGPAGYFEIDKGKIDKYSNRTQILINTKTELVVQLSDVTADDAGLYCCRNGINSNAPLIPNCTIQLIITGKPITKLTSSSQQPVLEPVEALVNELKGELNLTCDATSTTKPDDHSLSMVYTWFKDGVLYTTSNSNILHDTNITISSTGREITCTATDDPHCSEMLHNLTRGSSLVTVQDDPKCKGVLGVSTPFTIQPEYAPYKIVLKPPAERNIGDTLSVECSSDCNPRCNVSWSKDGKVIEHKSLLYIKQLQSLDEGFYICTVQNKYDVRNTTFNLNLSYKPMETEQQSKAEKVVNVGDTVNITREITAYPPPNLVGDSLVIPSGANMADKFPFNLTESDEAHHYNLMLTVRVISQQYMGIYCISVQNKEGNLTVCYVLKEAARGDEGITSGNTGKTTYLYIDQLNLHLSIGIGILVAILAVITIAIIMGHMQKGCFKPKKGNRKRRRTVYRMLI